MKYFLDMAISYYNESLTLIIGTGFSKWITNGKAPSWLELIIYSIDRIDPSLKNILLKLEDNGEYSVGEIPLTIVAQLLEIEAKRRNIELKEIVCECINSSTIDSNIDKKKLNYFVTYLEKKN